MNILDRIHEYLRFGSVLGLERMNTLLDKLGNPQDGLKVIHVAGTNGKGSICKYIYEVLRAAGYRVGLYTSPYLEVFNERIERNGEYISDEDLEKYGSMVLAKADEMVEEGLESPTEFEVVTAIAFLYFKKKGVDYAVLEVGLGGRGDSTNVVKAPLCSVIASISLDHTDRLGSTIAEIAFEKAGIIKDGCPVICGAADPDAKAVLRKTATDHQAPFFDATLIQAEPNGEDVTGTYFDTEILGKNYVGIGISMGGAYQVENAVSALYALTLLQQQGKVSLTDEAIRTGMKKAKQIGRMEVLAEDPWVIIDGAHNPDGSRRLAESMEEWFAGKKIRMVTGILADKDVEDVMDNFRRITGDFVVTEPPNPRKLDAEKLAAKLREKGATCTVCADPSEAVRTAMADRENYDLVLFAGSLYLIGQIRKEIIDALQ